ADASAVAAWLDDVLDTPLGDGRGSAIQPPIRLRTLEPAGFVRELAFTLPAAAGNAVARTRRIVETVGQEFRIGGELMATPDWHGYLGGYIALVFEANGRYWLLDWKSNRLGSSDAAYHGDAMAEAIAGHGYALQFCLYTLALHRLLAARIPNYDYDRHVGGVFYAFVRGMTGADGDGAGVHFARPSRSLVERLDAQLAGLPAGGR